MTEQEVVAMLRHTIERRAHWRRVRTVVGVLAFGAVALFSLWTLAVGLITGVWR